MFAYEPYPQYVPTRRSSQHAPPPPLDAHGNPQAIVLLTPQAQPTVVWPMPMDENMYFYHMQQQQQLNFPPQNYTEPDPLAHHRRFPSSPTSAANPLPAKPEFMQQTAAGAPMLPLLGPYEGYSPRSFNSRWKPRPMFAPPNSFPRRRSSSVSSNPCPQEPKTSPTTPSRLPSEGPKPLASTPSQLASQEREACPPSTPAAAAASIAPSRALSPPPLPAPPPPPPPPPLLLHSPRSSSSSPELPSSPSASSVSKRRNKKLPTKPIGTVTAKTNQDSWKAMPWKCCRWLMSHEKSVVRLLLCLLLLGSLLLTSVVGDPKDSKKAFFEAENLSRPKYDWINSL